jgi:hypothetical protein
LSIGAAEMGVKGVPAVAILSAAGVVTSSDISVVMVCTAPPAPVPNGAVSSSTAAGPSMTTSSTASRTATIRGGSILFQFGQKKHHDIM